MNDDDCCCCCCCFSSSSSFTLALSLAISAWACSRATALGSLMRATGISSVYDARENPDVFLKSGWASASSLVRTRSQMCP